MYDSNLKSILLNEETKSERTKALIRLYGMGFKTASGHTAVRHLDQRQRRAAELFQENAARSKQLQQAMPGNRELLDKVRDFGFQAL